MIQFAQLSLDGIVRADAPEGYYLRPMDQACQIIVVGPMHSSPHKLSRAALELLGRRGHLTQTTFMEGHPSEDQATRQKRLERGFISLVVSYE